MKNRSIKFEIVEREGCFQLISIVSTDFGGLARNFVFEGSRAECEKVKIKLESYQK